MNEQKMKAPSILPGGKMYQGEMAKDLSQGEGVMTFANCDEYSGQWRDGRMCGYGVYRFYDDGRDGFGNARYEGMFRSSKFHGFGRMVYSDKSIYSGQWERGKREGFGKYVTAGGDVILGRWHDGDISEGTRIYADGSRYVGGFQHMRLSGQGVLERPDGTVWQGLWNDGRLESGTEIACKGQLSIIGD